VRYVIIILGWVKVYICGTRTQYGHRCIQFKGSSLWNSLPSSLKLVSVFKRNVKNICAEYRFVVWHCYLLVSLLYFVLLNTLYKFVMTLVVVLIYMYTCKLQNYFFHFFLSCIFLVWIVKYIVCLAAVGSQHDGRLPSCSLAFVLFYCLYCLLVSK